MATRFVGTSGGMAVRQTTPLLRDSAGLVRLTITHGSCGSLKSKQTATPIDRPPDRREMYTNASPSIQTMLKQMLDAAPPTTTPERQRNVNQTAPPEQSQFHRTPHESDDSPLHDNTPEKSEPEQFFVDCSHVECCPLRSVETARRTRSSHHHVRRVSQRPTLCHDFVNMLFKPITPGWMPCAFCVEACIRPITPGWMPWAICVEAFIRPITPGWMPWAICVEACICTSAVHKEPCCEDSTERVLVDEDELGRNGSASREHIDSVIDRIKQPRHVVGKNGLEVIPIDPDRQHLLSLKKKYPLNIITSTILRRHVEVKNNLEIVLTVLNLSKKDSPLSTIISAIFPFVTHNTNTSFYPTNSPSHKNTTNTESRTIINNR